MPNLKYLRIGSLFFTLLLSSTVYGQDAGSDYLSLRDSLIKLSCVPQEKAKVELSIEQLEGLDPKSFGLHRDRYYRDLAWGYYRRFMHSKDTTDVRLSLQTYGQLEDKSAERWNRLFMHSLLGECAQALDLLDEHLQQTPAEFHPKAEQIKHIRDRCL
jgi:hypothetical protein